MPKANASAKIAKLFSHISFVDFFALLFDMNSYNIVKMTYDKIYYPYPLTDTIKKFFMITNGKKIRFGANSSQHLTKGHLDEERKLRFLNREKNRKTGMTQTPLDIGLLNSYGYILLIKKVTKKIEEDVLKNGYITKEQNKNNIWEGQMRQGISYKFILGVFVSWEIYYLY